MASDSRVAVVSSLCAGIFFAGCAPEESPPSPPPQLVVAVPARRDATERSVDLVQTRYKAGLTDFQNELDSQRSLLNRQDQLAESEGDVVKTLIALYRALGGGWAMDENEPETYTSGVTTSSGGPGSE